SRPLQLIPRCQNRNPQPPHHRHFRNSTSGKQRNLLRRDSIPTRSNNRSRLHILPTKPNILPCLNRVQNLHPDPFGASILLHHHSIRTSSQRRTRKKPNALAAANRPLKSLPRRNPPNAFKSHRLISACRSNVRASHRPTIHRRIIKWRNGRTRPHVHSED